MVKWSAKADFNLSRFGGIVKSDANPRNPAQLIFGKAWSAKLIELGTNWINTEKNTIYLRLSDVLLGYPDQQLHHQI